MEGAQAKLMRARQDVKGARIRFRVDLGETQLARARAEGPARLGLAVKNNEDNCGLSILRINELVDFDTPVVLYNSTQRDQRTPWLSVQQGDCITSLNQLTAGNKMLSEIERQTAPTDTKKLSFTIERELDDRFEQHEEPVARPSTLVRRARSPLSEYPRTLSESRLSSSVNSLSRPSTQPPASPGGSRKDLRNSRNRSRSDADAFARLTPVGKLSSHSWEHFSPKFAKRLT
eukprot:TRINITY_DN44866_c0_g1_i1.p1 TRINITY_DN44866_c0_g1~~TRINITY_DN44866_c0_g1_i1.p1  ORF type:complete len:232 (+),score=20.67 TRINITY_DN44866_c0_g1_i1:23-718(+)